MGLPFFMLLVGRSMVGRRARSVGRVVVHCLSNSTRLRRGELLLQ